MRVTTGVKPSCSYRLPQQQKIQWFLTAAAYWQKSTKVSLLCSEMASPGERRYRKPLRSPSPLVERHSSEPL